MIKEFKDWLEKKYDNKRTRGSRLSEAKKVEEYYGDLYQHFLNGTYQKIVKDLEYSKQDKDNNKPNPSKIKIDGDIKNGLNSYKAAANLYLKFLKEQHIKTFEDYQTFEDENLKQSLEDSTQNRAKRLKSAAKKPTSRTVEITVYHRNPDVKAEVLNRANGICESCNNKAPFNRSTDGTPYLEVHHKIPLANGGEDTIENAIALCPNCHRKAHHG